MTKIKENNKKIKIDKKFIILGLFIAIFLIFRLMVLFNANESFDPYSDQCKIGTLTKNIVNGDFSAINFISQSKNYPFSIFGVNFALNAYSQIVLGFFAVPFFILFGISAFSLNITALAISLSALIIIYNILEKVFNLKVAILTALLFIFAPYSYNTNSVVVYTYNFEVFILSILIIFFLFKLTFDKKNYLQNVIILGFLCGFSFFNNMINLILIANCLLFLIIFNKKFFFSKYIPIFFVFFVLGMSPEIIYNYKFAIGNTVPNSGVGGISLSNIKEVVLYDIPASFNFGDLGPIKGGILNYTYYTIFIISFFFVVFDNKDIIKPNLKIKVKNRKKKELFFLLYPPLFIFFSLFNLLSVEHIITTQSHRHILPLYMFIFVIIALFIVKLWFHNKKIISIILTLIIIILGITVKTNLISSDNAKQIYPTTCDSLVASDFPLFAMMYTDNISFISKGCDQFKDGLKLDCYTGLGQRVYLKYKGNLNLSFKECNNFKNNLSKPCIFGLANSAGYDYNLDLNRSIKKCDTFEKEFRKRCYFTLGRSISSHYQKNKSFALKECKKIKNNNKHDCIDGASAIV